MAYDVGCIGMPVLHKDHSATLLQQILGYLLTIGCMLFAIGTQANPQQPLIVLLDWFPNPNQAPLFVAQAQGFFTQQGLTVKLIGPADPADPPKLVAAGKADIAITYQPQFLQQIDHGLPLVQLGTLINHPLNCLVARQESDIKTLKKLRGKNIGYSTSGTDSVMLETMLSQIGLSLKDVNLINVHYDLTQALLVGRIDAAIGMMRNFEVLQLQMAGHSATVFYPEHHGMPSYSELIFVVNRDKAHDPRFIPFLHAVKQGVIYLKQHPKQTWQTFAKTYPETNNPLNAQAWQMTQTYFSDNPASIDQQQLQKLVEFMHDHKLISTIKPINTYQVPPC